MIYWRKEAQTSAPITILGFFLYLYITRNQSPVHAPLRLVCRFLMLNTFDVICDLFLKQTQDNMESICCLTKKDENHCFILLKQTPCFSDPCISNATCVVNYKENDYHCSICPPFYNGKDCGKGISYSASSISILFFSTRCFFLLLLNQSPGRSRSQHG